MDFRQWHKNPVGSRNFNNPGNPPPVLWNIHKKYDLFSEKVGDKKGRIRQSVNFLLKNAMEIDGKIMGT